jgi:hypothetical protein
MKKDVNAKGNTLYREETHSNQKKFLCPGVGFIKTRMADYKVAGIQHVMESILDSIDVELIDLIVDRSGSHDIDRKAIDDIYEWLDNAPVHVLIVDSFKNISDDKDDFDGFMEDMNEREIILICLEGNKIIMPGSESNYADDDEDEDDE